MQKAFTLIELLIVLVIMVLVMGVVVPMGSKMLDRYEKKFETMKEKSLLSQNKAVAFFTLHEQSQIVDDMNYTATIKGVIVAKRYDHR